MNEYYLEAIGILSTAIAVLWGLIVKHNAKISNELDNCRKSHRETSDKMLDMSTRLGRLEGSQAATKDLAERVITEVKKAVHQRRRSDDKMDDIR